MLKLILLSALTALVLAEDLAPEPRYLEDLPLTRVVGGEVAKPHSWPWQISLQYQSGSSFRHTCGGSLIKRGWVMTAAHCVDSQRTWRVVLGDHNLNTNEGTEQILSVSQVYIHSGWNSNSVSGGNDIALLRLSTEATLNSNVQLAALPSTDYILPNNNPCYITGWGLTSTGGSLSPTLKQAYLPSVDHKTCSSPDWWGSTVKTTMVCGGGGANSGCNGDSGGPLNCQVNGQYQVHGIASFVSGYGCNAARKPTVFTRVSAFIGWMNGISLQYQSGSSFYHTCGGTLIRRGWVMTAAHCVDSQRTWRVVLGDHNLNTNEGTEQILSVSKVYIHSGWNSNSVAGGYDIALLRLSTEVTLNTYVQLGTLPSANYILPNNNPCYITGWGRTATGGSLSNSLKQAWLPSVDHQTCSSSGWWGSTVKTTMVCAGGGANSGCQGDSGGPLNCQVNGQYQVHGVTSFVSASGCNANRKPTVFTRVSAYISWINGVSTECTSTG
ncbi:hypothetical protein UPYG_G00163400 [Umbra pygmaea]|uniref:pancreatic elastase n=1 Tax=Umbra pygmaea TaxID=75934 RepID=A0ABD0WM23_UMBPY